MEHVRLAILDLTPAAAQPMRSPDGRFVLIYNGEICNFRELRKDIIERGHKFHSAGDGVVLLHGLMEYSPSFIERINGIFAFALWDRQERELLLVRDQLGGVNHSIMLPQSPPLFSLPVRSSSLCIPCSQ